MCGADIRLPSPGPTTKLGPRAACRAAIREFGSNALALRVGGLLVGATPGIGSSPDVPMSCFILSAILLFGGSVRSGCFTTGESEGAEGLLVRSAILMLWDALGDSVALGGVWNVLTGAGCGCTCSGWCEPSYAHGKVS
jgi:hypothetical protein